MMKILMQGTSLITDMYAMALCEKHDVTIYERGKKYSLLKSRGYKNINCSNEKEDDYDYIFVYAKDGQIETSLKALKNSHAKIILITSTMKDLQELHNIVNFITIVSNTIFVENKQYTLPFTKTCCDDRNVVNMLTEANIKCIYTSDIQAAMLCYLSYTLPIASLQQLSYKPVYNAAKRIHFNLKKMITFNVTMEPGIMKLIYFIPEPFLAVVLLLCNKQWILEYQRLNKAEIKMLCNAFDAYIEKNRFHFEEYFKK